MIIRIVRMTFVSEKTDEFLEIFNKYKRQIRMQPGCQHLELLQDHHQKNVYTTYSHWNTEDDLNNYRYSETFGLVWPATKALFYEKPVAQSYVILDKIEA